jgi:hypothetical protein
MRHWTDETDTEAEEFFATLPDREIRRRQDLCSQQIRTAHERRNEDALADLRRMEDALTRTMLRRYTHDARPETIAKRRHPKPSDIT